MTNNSTALQADCFLLKPDNADLLAGRRSWSSSVSGTMMSSLVGMWVVFAALILAYQAWAIWPELLALYRHGVDGPGVVTDLRNLSGSSESDYRVAYRFEPGSGDGSGKSFTGEDKVDFRTFQSLKIGDAVTVHYASTDPSRSRLSRPGPLPAILIVAATVAINVGFLAVFLLLRRKRRRDERLSREGRIVQGKVRSCMGRKDSEGHFEVQVQYSFPSPQGRQIDSAAKARRDDLRETQLPVPGAAVAVLVVDESLYQLL